MAAPRGMRQHLGYGVRIQHLAQFVPVQSEDQFPHESDGDNARAGRCGMDEIRRDQPGLALVLARHGPRASHRLECVEESATQLGGHAALNLDDAGHGRQRFKLAAILLAAVHGTHHQYRSIGQRGAHPRMASRNSFSYSRVRKAANPLSLVP
jgi:hypothetical protein